MANYAYLDNNNVVVSIIYGKDENTDGIDWEEYYSTPINKAKRTSWNTKEGQHSEGKTPFRKNFGEIGYTFREDLNVPEGAFVGPKPYESWILDEDRCVYVPPVQKPEGNYIWNETNKSWEEYN